MSANDRAFVIALMQCIRSHFADAKAVTREIGEARSGHTLAGVLVPLDRMHPDVSSNLYRADFLQILNASLGL